LEKILKQLLERSDFERSFDLEQAAKDLARAWFHSKSARTKVAKLLRKFNMNEDAIEAEAFRLCDEDVERLDRNSRGVRVAPRQGPALHRRLLAGFFEEACAGRRSDSRK
jgi:hypothetical protein